MKCSLSSTILAVLALAGCDDSRDIDGSGRLVDARRDVAAFHAVRVSDGLRADIVVGPQSVALHLDDNIIDHVSVTVSGGVLVLEAKDHGTGFDPSADAVIVVASPTMDSVTVTDGAVARAEARGSEVVGECRDGASLNLTVRDTHLVRATTRDGCHAVLSGTAPDLKIETSDGSDVDSQLVSETADIHARDGSDVRARVTKSVRVVATDGSGVRIHGNPAGREVTSSDGSSVEFAN